MSRKNDGPTQKELLLQAFKDHPEGITSVWMVINLHMLGYTARISEMRQGMLNNTPYNIQKVHVSGNLWKYVLREPVGQLALF